MDATGLNALSDIPKAWRSALASVQLTFPDAVMAGGCLRDRDLGVKVKDIDIFISTTTPGIYGSKPIIDRLRDAGWADVALNGDESYKDESAKRGIVAVLDLKYPGCPPVNLIAMKQFRLEEFDFGICQIMFDGKRIVRLPDYHHDLAAKQFRIIPKVTDAMFVRSLGRWARLRERYPEWKLHLGSRAEDAPFVPPKTVRRISQSHPNMQQISRNPIFDKGIHPPFAMGGYLRTSPIDVKDIIHMAGDYVVTKAVAERLAKETTARLLRSDPITQTCTVHVDDRAVTPSANIVREMLEAQQRLERDMQARRSDHQLDGLRGQA